MTRCLKLPLKDIFYPYIFLCTIGNDIEANVQSCIKSKYFTLSCYAFNIIILIYKILMKYCYKVIGSMLSTAYL